MSKCRHHHDHCDDDDRIIVNYLPPQRMCYSSWAFDFCSPVPTFDYGCRMPVFDTFDNCSCGGWPIIVLDY